MNTNDKDLAIAVSNVITLVDIARKDVLELDVLMKVGINGQPSILVEIDRLKSNIKTIEDKIASLGDRRRSDRSVDQYNRDSIELNSDVDALSLRIAKVERLVYIASGICATLMFVISFSAKIIKTISVG